jgi:hypothetical protein
MKPQILFGRCFAGEMKAKKTIVAFALVLVTMYLSHALGMKTDKIVSRTRHVSSAVIGNQRIGSLVQPPIAAESQIAKAYGKLPLSFEANQGQTDPQVKFLSRGNRYSLFLTSTEAVLALQKPARGKHIHPGLPPSQTWPAPQPTSTVAIAAPESSSPADVLRMKIVGSNTSAKIAGADELPGKSNYFIGDDPNKWRTNVSNYSKVKYHDVYPGIDLIYYGNQGQLEHDFVVAPGTDSKVILLAFRGARKMSLNSDGDLVLGTKDGEVQLKKPHVYQKLNGEEQTVAARYVMKRKDRVGFEVAEYDRRQPLVIDPVLSYSTYLGGSGSDYPTGIAVDPSGNAYVTGTTGSTNFPTTSGAFQTTLVGSLDTFVTKLNPTGSALVYSTYLGGSGVDVGNGIAVDALGNAYVTGTTGSTNFPTTPGAFQTASGGALVAFVTKLNPTGSALVYSSYLGGSSENNGLGIALDALGNAFVTGITQSTNFPTTGGAFHTTFGGGTFDAYVTKLNATGSALVYSTYLGGGGDDSSNGIAVDSSGNAYMTGITRSANFPTTSGAFQTTTLGDGGQRVFVTKLNPIGSALVYSTYLGGSSSCCDSGNGIALDSSGNAYVAGQVFSTDFPTTSGAFKTTLGGSMDAFVTKLNPTGSALVYSTYLGGNSEEGGYHIAVDSSGSAWVTGQTKSTDFPTTPGAFQTAFGGGSQDAFVTKLNTTGSALVYSTYLGGSGADLGSDIAVDSSGNAYVTGQTFSANFPTTPGAFQTANGGGGDDAFVAKFAFSSPTLTVTNTNDSGSGSLRDAIAIASPGSTINFSLPLPATITLTTGELLINKDLTISGPGASSLAISGNNSVGVFAINGGITVSISGVTIQNGNAGPSGAGGGISNPQGTLTLTDSTVSGNSARDGGGLYNNGTMTVTHSTVSGNSAGFGGGIENTGKVTVTNSTVSNNSANYGGGIYNAWDLTVTNSTVSGNSALNGGYGGGIIASTAENGSAVTAITYSTLSGNFGTRGGGMFNGGTLTITNSTLSDNSASNDGGGISNIYGTLTLTNSTLSSNSALYGGGVYSYGTLTAKNSILANSPSGGNCALAFGSITSQGHNLSDDTTCSSFFIQTGDLNNIPAGLDPGGLQNNGGPTQTIALLCGSLAIDAGDDSVLDPPLSLSTDQRGFARKFGSHVDIGAFELQQSCTQAPVASCKNVTVSAGANCTANASIDNGSFDPDPGDTITLSQSPSGPYPLGNTTVTLTVTNNHGASSSCSATVTVVDNTPPALTLPANITTDATSPSGAVVTYRASAIDLCDGTVAVICTPPPGSTFPIGTTTVSCQATDHSGNTAHGTFQVLVQAAAAQVTNLVTTVQSFNLANGITNSLDAKLDNALSALNAAKSGGTLSTCNQLNAFISQTLAQSGKQLTTDQANQLIASANRIKAVIGCP